MRFPREIGVVLEVYADRFFGHCNVRGREVQSDLPANVLQLAFFLVQRKPVSSLAIMIYLTRWFTLRDRARAIAALYSAAPVSAFIGSAIAGWLLHVHWIGITGWR